jgi:hypothetical protein
MSKDDDKKALGDCLAIGVLLLVGLGALLDSLYLFI